jgi:hypothetical protein
LSRVRIEQNGHIVEVEDTKIGMRALANLAERTWQSTRPTQMLTMGFGSQVVERVADRPISGGGAYEVPVLPVTG